MKSEFLEKPSSLYETAVKALEALARAEGTDVANRAFAEIAASRSREEYAKHHNLKQSQGHACIQRLLGKHCEGDCKIPGSDHETLWLQDGKPTVFVSQPYEISWQTMQELVEFCKTNDLEASVSARPSWHFPGAVVTTEVKRQGSLS